MLLKKFDKDGNGKLDIEEFSDFYAEAKATYVIIHCTIDDSSSMRIRVTELFMMICTSSLPSTEV